MPETAGLHKTVKEATRPVEKIATDPDIDTVQTGLALCLSGGGYRAMLFHAGSICRLNELGLLPHLKRISSVSGGSITAGVLGLAWNDLAFDEKGRATKLEKLVIDPLREFAGTTLDIKAGIEGLLSPQTIADRVAAGYASALFGKATLQDLPDTPEFIINATSVQTKSLFRFTKKGLKDWRVGQLPNPKLPLASAVAASTAFPPFLSPMVLRFDHSDWRETNGAIHFEPAFTERVVLTDGGVYDNLGLETAWKKYSDILVSDAGGKYGSDSEPAEDWAMHSYRVFQLIDSQVRSMRQQQIIASINMKTRRGAYWSVHSDLRRSGAPDALPVDPAVITELAATRTRLAKLDSERQKALINWGYACCDANLRRHYKPSIPGVDLSVVTAPAWPYADAPLDRVALSPV